MNKETDTNSLVIHYMALRRLVGYLGSFLPIATSLGGFMIFGTGIRSTISNYYYTGMRGWLVGTLFAMGFFMWSYRGYEQYRGHRHVDNWAGNACCLFSVVCALFPEAPDVAEPCRLQVIFGYVHLISATLFFVTLIFFSCCLFTQSSTADPPRRKKQRNRVFGLCGIIMALCVVLGGVYAFVLPHELAASLECYHPLFWLEAIAIEAFGVSWMTKGQTILRDPK